MPDEKLREGFAELADSMKEYSETMPACLGPLGLSNKIDGAADNIGRMAKASLDTLKDLRQKVRED